MPAFVQSTSATFAASTGPSIGFASAVTAGNAIAAFVSWGSATANLTSVTDSLGNTYTLLDNPTANAGSASRGATAYAVGVTGGANTLTYHFDTTTTCLTGISEISGISISSPIAAHIINTQSNVSSGVGVATSSNITTVSSGCFLFAGVADVVQGGTWLAGTGYTKRSGAQSIQGSVAVEDVVQSSSGTTNATFNTATSGMYPTTALVAFAPTGGGGGGGASAKIHAFALLGVT